MDEASFDSRRSSTGTASGRELVLLQAEPRGDGSCHGSDMLEILERNDSRFPVSAHEAGGSRDQQDLHRFVWYLMEENDKLKVELVEARRQTMHGAALLTELDKVMMDDIDKESKKLYLEDYHQNIEIRRKDRKKNRKEKRSKKKVRASAPALTDNCEDDAFNKSWPSTSVSTLVTASTSDMTPDGDDLSRAAGRDMPRDLYTGQEDTGQESLTIEYLDSRGKHDDDGESAASLAPPNRVASQRHIFPLKVEMKGKSSKLVKGSRRGSRRTTEHSPAIEGIVCNHSTFVHCVIVHGHDKPIKVMEEWQ